MILGLLCDLEIYESEIERLYDKQLASGNSGNADGEELQALYLNRGQLIDDLAHCVATGQFVFEPGVVRVIEVNGKTREVFHFPLLTRIVHRVVATILMRIWEPLFKPSLKSYRKGMDYVRGAQEFAFFLRGYSREVSDPLQRGLYVIRRDVAKYTDTIPVSEDSPLWEVLRKQLFPNGIESESEKIAWRILKEVIQPELLDEDGQIKRKQQGVPTGSPISVALFNIYLHSLDTLVESMRGPDGFYLRYSDDVIFAHPEPERSEEVMHVMDRELERLKLRFNIDKEENLYLTSCGKPSSRVDWRGAQAVGLLGFNIHFKGVLGLSEMRLEGFFSELSKQIHATLAKDRIQEFEERGMVACRVIRQTLEANTTHTAKAFLTIKKTVTDRGQLKAIDHELCRLVLKAAMGRKSAKGFRRISKRQMYKSWGLPSMLQMRNAEGKGYGRLGQTS